MEKLEKEMARLRGKRDDISNQIAQAEREERIPTAQVIQWLWEVETLERQVTDIEQDFQSMSRFSCNCFHRAGGTLSQTQQEEDITLGKSSNCFSTIRRVPKELGKAKELMSRARALDSIARVELWEPTVTLPMSYRPPVGIESYVEDIVDYIDGGEDKIIGIYGMGGVGKTTIMKSIEQHYFLKRSIFDRVIWVVASKDCQLKRLQMDIAKRLEMMILQESDDELTCGDKLFSYLKNKNCLLLLDDIWEHVDLQLLGMTHSVTQPGQQQPCKVVVFTTRSEIVCAQMKAQKKIKVNCLDSDRAWQLFIQNSDEDVLSSDAGIKFFAHELAKECAGLPLALITVARAMSGKKAWEAWKDALHQIRDKHEWTTIGFLEDSLGLYKAFKLSYDSLENDSIRACLLCCALWPEDYEINKFEQLIPCWIGCGIIREFNVINEAFAKGCSYLEALVAANLLEQSSRQQYHYKEKYVKMHSVIRDIALLMVSGLEGEKRKWIVKTGIGLRHLPRQEEWQEAELASFMSNQITPLPEYGASTFSQLFVLILHENRSLKTIPPSLFASMPHLTYLDLTLCDITELPMEISSLTELQYLNLSGNPITRLPAEFHCLGKLEYLILRNTEIVTVPNGTISNLSMLRWLDISGVFRIRNWWSNELKCFKGRHQLSVAIDIYATTVNIVLLNMLPNVSIWHLTLYGDLTIDGDDSSELSNLNIHEEDVSELPDLTIDGGDTSELPDPTIDGGDISELLDLDLGTPQWSNISGNLESLEIKNFEVGKLIFHESSFRSLKKLTFHNLLLEEISLNGIGLYHLRELNVSNCRMLKDVSWVLQLPNLNLLLIEFCPGMKKLISDEGNSDSRSTIQSLTLFTMWNLNCIANQPLHFPYLEYMHVVNCPKLKKLSFGAEILNCRLKEIQGDETWWSNLEWDDERDKNSLTPHFVRRRVG